MNTHVLERLRSEQAFHDEQARTRAATFRLKPQLWRFSDDYYLDHEPWIRRALAQLGDVRGKRVLDFGCGHGMAAVVLARRGACVTAFDLSAGYVREARDRARANDVRIDCVQANGESLPFASGSFDCIWGHAILHHLNVRHAGREIRRVLAPAGRAVFCEPWGGNPLLGWARGRFAYPGKSRTPDERPLGAVDIEVLREIFASVETAGFQLFSMLGRILPRGRFIKALASLDERILKCLPGLQRWCRYVVATCTAI